jgi:cytochrome c5
MMLLWLLFALLPLRAWAGVTMHLPEASSSAPCHADMQAAAEGAADDPAADNTACSLCSVCHGGALPAAPAATPVQQHAAQTVPTARPGVPPRRDPDALFKPPRI